MFIFYYHLVVITQINRLVKCTTVSQIYLRKLEINKITVSIINLYRCHLIASTK